MIVEEVFVRGAVVADRATKAPIILVDGFGMQPARHVGRKLLRAVIAGDFSFQRMSGFYVFPQVKIPFKHFLTNIAFDVLGLLVVSQRVLVCTASPA